MGTVSSGILELMERGGVVMYPLLALSVVAVAVILERSWFWMRANRPTRTRRFHKLARLLADGDEKARRLMLTDDSVYGQVYREMVDAERFEVNAVNAVEMHRPALERFMVTLSTIITAAPLLGILGTVLGIIQSFDLLGSQEAIADPTSVSSGIAEALLTTAFGLTIALLALFPYMIFRGQVERTLGRFEVLAAAVQAAGGGVRETSDAPGRTKVRPSE